MKVRRDLRENLLSAFPTLALRQNFLMTDECAVYLNSWLINVYLWPKHNPHFFEEIQQHRHSAFMDNFGNG